jgi:hypothetical protein
MKGLEAIGALPPLASGGEEVGVSSCGELTPPSVDKRGRSSSSADSYIDGVGEEVCDIPSLLKTDQSEPLLDCLLSAIEWRLLEDRPALGALRVDR